jgi:hypothetical protein
MPISISTSQAGRHGCQVAFGSKCQVTSAVVEAHLFVRDVMCIRTLLCSTSTVQYCMLCMQAAAPFGGLHVERSFRAQAAAARATVRITS